MKNLIFVAKETGLECLKFHLEKFNNDENCIVVCDPDKDKIIGYLNNQNLPYQDVINFSTTELEGKKFDWLLNLWGGVIFKKEHLILANHSLNIHPSYLPHGRGRDPVVWSIRHEHPAGVTLHEINEQVDEGDIWYQEEVPYTLPTTGNELYQRVVSACIRVFMENWPQIRSLQREKMPQTSCGMLTKKRKDLLEDKIINFDNLNSNQREILLKILAHDFGKDYSAIIEINGSQYQTSLKLEKIEDNNI